MTDSTLGTGRVGPVDGQGRGEETIAAIATPPGSGALGVVRLSGPQSSDFARSFLTLPVPMVERRATLASARDGTEPIDKVVATWFPAENSPTGEDLIEISAHGSPYILRRLLEAALSSGARLALPGEFTQRSFLNGKLDLAQAEAVCDLIRARTDSAHRAALSQLEGGLSREVGRLREPILDLLVSIEACLDHPEEDIPALESPDSRWRISQTRDSILKLASTFVKGRLAAEGARVCIVGRPNAGKSSLLNAILGTDRAIVCPAPGTTRDTLEEAAAIAGFPAVLIDTAGLREGSLDEAERSGIERSERALKASDIALLVIDASRPAGEEDRRVHARIRETALRAGRPLLTVLNKSDLPSPVQKNEGDVCVSALEGRGIPELLARVADALADGAASPESVMVVSARHHGALSEAAEQLRLAEEAVRLYPGRWEDRAASLLRAALQALDGIVGLGTPDEVLHGIFSRFCVGK